MGKSATEVRREIVQTRGELSETIEALEERIGETKEAVVDKVSPSRIWQRKTAGIRSRFDHLGATIGGSRQAVAGSVNGARAAVTETSTTTTERTGELMARTNSNLSERAENNPMAAGLLALGVGFLAATLLPPTERERQAAGRLQSGLQPLKEQATTIGKDIAGELQQSAQGSVEQLKGQAAEAVERVKEDAQSSSDEMKEQAQSATAQVKGRASRASREVKETATDQAKPTKPRLARAPGTRPRRAPVRARSTTS
jgi:uncharacterized protein YjbJ (UPF0337 family)